METVQFKGLIDFMQKFDTEEKCEQYLLEALYPNKSYPCCPRCKKQMRYCKEENYWTFFKCGVKKCNFYKQSLVKGTMFYKTQIPLQKWFIAIYLFTTNGITAVKLAQHIEVCYSTAWIILHKIRVSVEYTNLNKKLCGEVEADETYVGADRKKGNKRGRGSRDKIVFGALERNGRVYAKVIPDCGGAILKPIVYKKVRKRARLYTDGWNGYKGLTGFTHFRVKHKDSIGETSRIERFWGTFKSTLRIYRGVSKKHLQKYVNEVVFRHNYRKHQTHEAFNTVLCKCFEYMTWWEISHKPYILD